MEETGPGTKFPMKTFSRSAEEKRHSVRAANKDTELCKDAERLSDH